MEVDNALGDLVAAIRELPWLVRMPVALLTIPVAGLLALPRRWRLFALPLTLPFILVAGALLSVRPNGLRVRLDTGAIRDLPWWELRTFPPGLDGFEQALEQWRADYARRIEYHHVLGRT